MPQHTRQHVGNADRVPHGGPGLAVPGDAPMVRSLTDADVITRSQQQQIDALADRLRLIEKQLDTLGSPWWKRLLFRVDGWPAWWVVARKPKWRPWRSWWTS
jgi:hypothetical protein